MPVMQADCRASHRAPHPRIEHISIVVDGSQWTDFINLRLTGTRRLAGVIRWFWDPSPSCVPIGDAHGGIHADLRSTRTSRIVLPDLGSRWNRPNTVPYSALRRGTWQGEWHQSLSKCLPHSRSRRWKIVPWQIPTSVPSVELTNSSSSLRNLNQMVENSTPFRPVTLAGLDERL